MQENSSFNTESASQIASQSAPKEKATSFNMSLVALALVVILTGVFHVLTMTTNNSVTANTEKVAAMQQEIDTLKSEKKNAIAALVENDNITTSLNLTNLVTALSQLATKYQVSFQNFAVKDNEISTNLIAKNSDKDAVQKIIVMMNEFAKTGQQASFSLEPIFSISGDQTTRTTPITFKIVPKNNTITPTDPATTASGSENSSN